MNCLIGDTERLITNDMLLCTAPSPSSIPNAENARSGIMFIILLYNTVSNFSSNINKTHLSLIFFNNSNLPTMYMSK